MFSTFKNALKFKKYLSVVDIRKYRVALTKFCCSNHSLYVVIGR